MDTSSGTGQTAATPAGYDVSARGDVDLLHSKAVGLFGVLFLTVTGAAPISAMLFNVPVAVGYGNGLYAPAGFAVATIILLIFSVGYATMARKVTAAGGFYSFISYGLGRELGMGMAFAALLAYSVIEASLCGGFAYFMNLKLHDLFGWNVAWPILALIMVVLISAVTFFDVRISTMVLGVALIGELIILLVFDIGIFGHANAGAHVQWAAVNPFNAFTGFAAHNKLAAGAAGIGIFFAFWSWVGFEMAPNYGEESRDPKRIIPLSLYVSVLLLGILYVLTSWASLSGYVHLDSAVGVAQSNAAQYFFTPANRLLGNWVTQVMSYLILTGSFACGLAFHNTASRYFYALGRERVMPSALGKTHPHYKSPYVASILQTGVAAIIVLAFAVFAGSNNPATQAYLELYGLMAVLATLVVMCAQAVVCIAIINYFYQKHRDEVHWWKTILAPIIAFVGQAYIIYLLITNLSFLGGGYAFANWIPWIALAAFVIGIGTARYLKMSNPAKYEIVGRLIYVGADAEAEGLSSDSVAVKMEAKKGVAE